MGAAEEFIKRLESLSGERFLKPDKPFFGFDYIVKRGEGLHALAFAKVATNNEFQICLDAAKWARCTEAYNHLIKLDEKPIRMLIFVASPGSDFVREIPPFQAGHGDFVVAHESFKRISYANYGNIGQVVVGRGNGVSGMRQQTNPVPAVSGDK